MSRRFARPSHGDPAEFRDRWRRLAERARDHAAAPDQLSELDVDDIVTVTARAENDWTRLSGHPRAACCSLMAHAYRAFARQRTIHDRRAMAPLLTQAAELVLQLHAETEPGAAAEAPAARAQRFRADLDG